MNGDLTMAQRRGDVRIDHLVIAGMIEKGSRVLDIGCGDGALLDLLGEKLGVDGRGIELSREGVNESVARGLAVVQGDGDTDLAFYPDDAFDYVILSQTIQAMRAPKTVLEHMLRIGRRAVISFPNFGHWRMRSQIFFKGAMPVTEALPYRWYDTPNIHFCTIRDFIALVDELDAHVLRAEALNALRHGHRRQRSLVVLEPVWRTGRVSAGAKIAVNRPSAVHSAAAPECRPMTAGHNARQALRSGDRPAWSPRPDAGPPWAATGSGLPFQSPVRSEWTPIGPMAASTSLPTKQQA